jgi:hypothetical protein
MVFGKVFTSQNDSYECRMLCAQAKSFFYKKVHFVQDTEKQKDSNAGIMHDASFDFYFYFATMHLHLLPRKN